jgi:threonine/homoserine/homoserine lactone efflux protein
MDPILLAKGLTIGFSIAAPVGPIGLLCIVRTLSAGRLSGLVTGLGAATADLVYGCVGGFGVTVLTRVLIDQQTWIRVIGGGFLIYLGMKYFIAKPGEEAAVAHSRGLAGDFGSTFILTLTNPMTAISFGAVFASLGIGLTSGSSMNAVTLLLGIFSGSALWWIVLSSAVNLFRGRIDSTRLNRINRVAGLIIIGFGAAALMSLVAQR